MAVVCLWGATALAESRDLGSKPAVENLFRPNTLKARDAVYREYFSAPDGGIRQAYLDRWRYHDLQIRFYQNNLGSHLDIGTLSRPGIGPQEQAVRNEFASMVMRMRLESAVKAYFASENRPALRKAHQMVEKVKSVRVKTGSAESAASGESGGGGVQGEFRFGYNLIQDTSHLEYIIGSTGAGFYHGNFMSSLTGGSPFISTLSFQVSQELGTSLPRAVMGYAFDGRYLSTSLIRTFSPQVTGQLYTIQPLQGSTATSSVNLQVVYTF